jgi:hypothetical protein
MTRVIFSFLLVLSILTGVYAADSATGDWEGSYQTDGYQSGTLRAKVEAAGDNRYKAVVSVPEFGQQFPLEGQEEEGKVVFNGTVDLGYELGSYQIKGEINESVFSGRFSGAQASGTFRMSRVE